MTGIVWRLTHGRGPAAAQLPLTVCIVLAVVVALLGRAESSIFDNARARLTDWTSPALTQIRAPLAAAEQWAVGVQNIFRVNEMNARLLNENAELRKWQNVALALEHRVKRYEELLKAAPATVVPTATARIIGQSKRPFVKTLVLDAGIEDGVEKGQAVADDRGLIGRVYVAGEKASWVILLSDLNSHVPAIIYPSNRRAILTGDNSRSPILELQLGDMPVRAGDRVVSSGDGGLVPPDVPIGLVVEDGNGFRVALFADPDLSDFVQVLGFAMPAAPLASQVSLDPRKPVPATGAGPSNTPSASIATVAATTTVVPTPAQPQVSVPTEPAAVLVTATFPPVPTQPADAQASASNTAQPPARLAATVGRQREDR